MIVKAVFSELTVQPVRDADGCALHNIVLTVCGGEKWENRFWIIRHYIVIITKQCGIILNSINLRAITIYERFSSRISTVYSAKISATQMEVLYYSS